jgi:autotransporter translocation and assembly factor TamB
LQSDVKVTGSLDSPLITGNVSASDGNIVIPPVLPAAKGQVAKYSIDPKFDVKVVFGKDMWFRNPRVVALMGQKDSYISVKGSLSSPNIDGRVVVAEGYIRLPTARLRLVKGGTVDFTYAPSAQGSTGSGVVSATINVEGKTTVTALSPAGARKQYQISMLVRGPVDNMNVVLKSNPPDLSQNRILALLGHVEDIFTPGDVALKEDLSQVFTALAGGAVLGPFENAVTEALGLQEFRVVGGIKDPVAVYASREVLPDLSVSYYRSLNALDEEYFLRLSYQIKDKYAIGITKDDRNVSTLDANFTFRF